MVAKHCKAEVKERINNNNNNIIVMRQPEFIQLKLSNDGGRTTCYGSVAVIDDSFSLNALRAS